MRFRGFIIRDNPYIIFYCILLAATLALFILYDNQFNKRIQGSVGTPLPFRSVGDRGHIFFTDKNAVKHLVATTHFGYNLNISPLELGDAEEIYEHLNEEIVIDREKFFRSALKEGSDEYEIIKKDISEKVKESIEKRIAAYDLKGVWLESFKKREYLHGSLGAHVLGFVSVDDNDITRGQYGIESIFDDILSSASNVIKSTGTTVLEQIGELDAVEASTTGNIVLTIDLNVQQELEQQLKNIRKKWQADLVGGLVMDPETGAVIAMGAVPTFNPNDYSKVGDYSIFNNPIVENVYEMGSVFKPLTVVIGLDSGRVSVNDTYNDQGRIVVDGEVISNYDKRGRGPNTGLQTVLSQSLNTGAVFVLQKTGIGTYKDYMQEFRFDGTTRIDLPKEIPGLVGNLDSNREIEFATASFGQGIAVTPIAVARAFASLANGGFIVQPYVTKSIEQVRVGGVISGFDHVKERKRVFNEDATKQVTEMLIRTYDRGILSGVLRNPRYSIAAKTGTAQMVDPKTGKYAQGKFLHSFFGYLPARQPEFLVFLFAVDPKAEFASTTLARPFSNLTNFLFSYYAVSPDR